MIFFFVKIFLYTHKYTYIYLYFFKQFFFIIKFLLKIIKHFLFLFYLKKEKINSISLYYNKYNNVKNFWNNNNIET